MVSGDGSQASWVGGWGEGGVSAPPPLLWLDEVGCGWTPTFINVLFIVLVVLASGSTGG